MSNFINSAFASFHSINQIEDNDWDIIEFSKELKKWNDVKSHVEKVFLEKAKKTLFLNLPQDKKPIKNHINWYNLYQSFCVTNSFPNISKIRSIVNHKDFHITQLVSNDPSTKYLNFNALSLLSDTDIGSRIKYIYSQCKINSEDDEDDDIELFEIQMLDDKTSFIVQNTYYGKDTFNIDVFDLSGSTSIDQILSKCTKSSGPTDFTTGKLSKSSGPTDFTTGKLSKSSGPTDFTTGKLSKSSDLKTYNIIGDHRFEKLIKNYQKDEHIIIYINTGSIDENREEPLPFIILQSCSELPTNYETIDMNNPYEYLQSSVLQTLP
jgi:hypothetical protein